MAKKKPVVDEKVEETTQSEEEQVEVPKTPEEQVVELTEMLQRKQAEFVNYQKRMDEQRIEQTKFASMRLIEKLLPIVDMFDMAVAHKEKKDEFIEGMTMVHAQFNSVLEHEGVKTVSLLDQPFDPAKAQAMQTIVDPSKKDNTIVQEIQKCYMIGDRVIRHARVIVSKKEERVVEESADESN